MTTNLQIHDAFPEFEVPDHRKKLRRLSRFTAPGLLDDKLGFTDGYPRDRRQMRQLVQFQAEIAVNVALSLLREDLDEADHRPGQTRPGPSRH